MIVVESLESLPDAWRSMRQDLAWLSTRDFSANISNWTDQCRLADFLIFLLLVSLVLKDVITTSKYVPFSDIYMYQSSVLGLGNR